jgi:hypothetical protein
MDIKPTDIAIVIATLLGPFLAVYVTEQQRKKADVRNRKIHIFRTLMATRSACLAASHIEALNLVEVEFDSSQRQERAVVDSWRMYLAHLNDSNYPVESWEARRSDLLLELLYSMSLALGYSYDKSQIKTGTYYPRGYGDAESDHLQTRKLWLEVLKGERALPMKAFTSQPPPPPAQPPAPPH